MPLYYLITPFLKICKSRNIYVSSIIHIIHAHSCPIYQYIDGKSTCMLYAYRINYSDAGILAPFCHTGIWKESSKSFVTT
jgi:hypothetical protein